MRAALAHHCVMFLKSLNSAVVCAAVIGLWGLIVKNYAASVVAMVECVDRECSCLRQSMQTLEPVACSAGFRLSAEALAIPVCIYVYIASIVQVALYVAAMG